MMYLEALVAASRWEVEGICAANGTLKALREFPEHLRPENPTAINYALVQGATSDHIQHSRPLCSPVAQTNIGAYRQHVSDGHTVWALCMARHLDGG